MPRGKRRSSGKSKKTIIPCTYSLGYVRQDLYSCRKCTADVNGVHAAFCAGCRATCHADHPEEVFELYTKRNFRCDCGNTRAGNVCKLEPTKDDLNVENERAYSHNFDGKYCVCNRPYDESLPMAQCAMCEDWFHEACFKTDSQERGRSSQPFTIEYELVCKACVAKLPALVDYYETFHAWSSMKTMRKWGNAVANKACTRHANANSSIKPGALDLMFQVGFRVYLCKCEKCIQVYRAAGAAYITDSMDFVNPIAEDVFKLFNDRDESDESNDDDGAESEDAVEVGPIRKKRVRSVYDGDRIPRRAMEEPPIDHMSSRLDGRSVASVQERIFEFLSEHIKGNDLQVDAAEALSYVSGLKADLLASFRHQLDHPRLAMD